MSLLPRPLRIAPPAVPPAPPAPPAPPDQKPASEQVLPPAPFWHPTAVRHPIRVKSA
ncbi:MAG: hypothetical protein RMK84_20610 [Oscillochloridaceae bacterium]|nr:hypothetical protein [Oscillochloridaceae bacterium]